MLHKKVGLCGQNGKREAKTKLGDGAVGSNGVWVDGEVVQVLCNLYFQLNQQRLARNQRPSYANLI